MAASVTVLWLVAALLGGAFSLTCFHCNTAGTDCNDNGKRCDAKQDACITTITEIRYDKATQQKPTKQVVKACGEKKQCGQNFTMSFNSTLFYSSTICCESDSCKTGLIEVPVETPEKKNQLKCPYCNEHIGKCNDTDMVYCYGKENKCVSFKSKDGASVKTWKGCATENVCSMETVASLPLNLTMEPSLECNHAAPLLPGLLLPAAFGLALLKLLL